MTRGRRWFHREKRESAADVLNSSTSSKEEIIPELEHAFKNWPGAGSSDKQVFDYLKMIKYLVVKTDPALLEREDLVLPFYNRLFQTMNSDDYRIRTVTYALLRILTSSEHRLLTTLKRMVDIFAVRSADLGEEYECLEAMKLLGKMIDIYSSGDLKNEDENGLSNILPSVIFPYNVLMCFNSVVMNYYYEVNDEQVKISKHVKIALGVLLKISILIPDMIVENLSTDWISHIIGSPCLNSKENCVLLSRVICKWMENPELRLRSDMKGLMVKIFAPMMDFGFFHNDDPNRATKIRHQITAERAISACGYVLKEMLSTWSGFYALFCCEKTDEDDTMETPLTFLNYLGHVKPNEELYLRLLETIVNVVCEFMDTAYSKVEFSTWSEAIDFYKKIDEPDQYDSAVHSEFVVGEMTQFLDKGYVDLSKSNPLISCKTLVSYILLYNGLGQCLARVIGYSPNESLMIKATLLLSDLFRTTALYLPKDWKLAIMSTPTLLSKLTKLGAARWNDEDEELYQGASILLDRLGELDKLLFDLEERDKIADYPFTDMFVRKRCLGAVNVEEQQMGSVIEKMSYALGNYDINTKINWQMVEMILQHFIGSDVLKEKFMGTEQCHHFFADLLNYFAPSTERAMKVETKAQAVRQFRAGMTVLKVVCEWAQFDSYYAERLLAFIDDFVNEQDKYQCGNEKSAFTRQKIYGHAALYYALIGIIQDSEFGYVALLRTKYYF
ncbi:unnamed protein product [Bursaphelenchus okinawaensis]|uniref:Rapamycin-insensitive companion of mTOR N-terminal domain-containing protein n=1 Tax=Bursaphelenchus okinawaensis TaxID=465554 RepID=A0A811K3L8_9BILA|nr:unnamed protein product [Bursaphelenchus okinawaensis]CAG9091538.1 unnamed protein product [Bursaphelenchus okinawaensis]